MSVELAHRNSGWTMEGIPHSAVDVQKVKSEERGFSVYGRRTVVIAGPRQFMQAVENYFWPQAVRVRIGSEFPRVSLVIGQIDHRSLDGFRRKPITLYKPHQGFVEDFNDGIQYVNAWGTDRFIVNPHTGTCFSIVGNHVQVIQPDLEIGVQDALRVVKQIVITGLEGEGVVTMHASAFAAGAAAIAISGPKGAGKTTTALAAAAAGMKFITNDRLYTLPDDDPATVWGWTDPIRVIDAPGQPKRIVTLAEYADGDVSRLAVSPHPLAAVVIPEVVAYPALAQCVEIDRDAGIALVAEQLLPPRVRWLGFEPAPVPSAAVPHAPYYLRFTCSYRDIDREITTLFATLRQRMGWTHGTA